MMPERTITESIPQWLMVIGVAGAIGIGKCLLGTSVLTWELILGRAICSAGLGLSALAIGLWHPEVSFEVQLGAACALATVGTDVITNVINDKYGGHAHGKDS